MSVYASAVRNGILGLIAAGLVAMACGSSTAEPDATDVSPTMPAPSTDDAGAPVVADTDAAAPPGAPRDAIVAEVDRELALLKETHYQHPTHVVEADGVFDVDCSGWIDYVLGRAEPSLLASLTATVSTSPRPLAENYVSFFAAPPAPSTGWSAIADVADLVPGDIVAWLLPPNSSDTGHTMIVRAAPLRRDVTSFIVPVWDSVAEPHGATDSRTVSGATGIGEGEIVLIVDANGAPVAHEWSDGAKQLTEQITLGHAR